MKPKELLLVLCIIFPMLLLNLWIWFLGRNEAPLGHTFIPYHNSTTDYPTYISFIRQGIDGKLGVVNLFTIEDHKPAYLYVFYQTLGLLGRLFHSDDAHAVYHLSRYVIGIGYCFVVYAFFCQLFSKVWQRLLGLLLVIYSSSVPYGEYQSSQVVIRSFMTWWTYLDPIARFAFLPHYLAGHSLLLISLICYFQSAKQSYCILGAMVFAWLAGFIHPPSLFVFLLAVPVYALTTQNSKRIISAFAVCVGACTSLLVLNNQSSVFPWTVGRGYESLSFAVSVWDYALTVGPILIVGTVSSLFTYKQPYTILFIVWIVSSLIGSYDVVNKPPLSSIAFVKQLFPISNIRFLQMALWVPAAVFSVRLISGWLKHRWVLIISGIVWIVITFVGYPQAAFTMHAKQFPDAGVFTSPPNDWFLAQKIINQAPVTQKAVLAMPHAGAFIPGHSGWKSYVGANEVVTPNFIDKSGRAFAFYKGTLSVCDSYALLADNAIGVVFYGFDEQGIGNVINTYSFLKLWKTVGDTKLYVFTRGKPTDCLN